jgi:2-C-methyl-D-erythritol 4-phosphate cytidylyltransferase
VNGSIRAAAVIPAGGAGRRMGEGIVRKQYLELAGEPILVRAIRPFLEHPAFHTVVVALPAEDMADPPLFLPAGVTVVAGGETRGDSVRYGLNAVPRSADVVLIHDAARPLLSRAVVDRVLETAATGIGAVAAIPVVDTLKRVAPDGAIRETLDRAGIWRVQTPQGFPLPLILDAYRRAAEQRFVATDDAALVERYGGRVVVVEGDVRNIKVTRPEDLDLAETFLTTMGAP